MDQQEFLRNSWPEIADFVCSASVALLRRSSTLPYDFPASGTLIRIEDRLFVATAAHVIPADPNGGNLWVVSKKRRKPFRESVLEFLRFGKASRFDVGYLELQPKIATKFLECDGCAIDSVRILGPGRRERHVVLIGTPQELVRLEGKDGDEGIVPIAKPYLTCSLAPDEWPEVPPEAVQAQIDADIFIDFPQEGILELKTGKPLVYKTAEGYSGGGVWDLGFEPGSLWQPGDISLFGIQSRWNEEKRYLRAVQIVHWLRLLYDDYSDLRRTLMAQFPSLL